MRRHRPPAEPPRYDAPVLQRRLGRTGLMVSELCLGTAGFGAQPWAETSDPVLDAFVECGGAFIDTADVYGPRAGAAEEAVGAWMRQRGNRPALVVATKGGSPAGPRPDRGLSRRHLLAAVEDSLTRLGTDWIDLYQTHWPDPGTPDEETLSALDQMVRQGKVRYVGCSNVPAWRLAHALGVSARSQFVSYASVQPHYSLLARSGYERELADAAVELGVAVLPYRPLARGILTGRFQGGGIPEARWRSGPHGYDVDPGRAAALVAELGKIASRDRRTIAQAALAWLLAQPGVTAPVIGASTPEQVVELAGAAGYRLSAEHLEHLDEASEWRSPPAVA